MRTKASASPLLIAAVAALGCSGCGNDGRVTDLAPASGGAAAASLRPAPAVSAAPASSASAPGPQAAAAQPTASAVEMIPGMLVADRKAAIGSQLTGQVKSV